MIQNDTKRVLASQNTMQKSTMIVDMVDLRLEDRVSGCT